MPFEPGIHPETDEPEQAYWFPLVGMDLVLDVSGPVPAVLRARDLAEYGLRLLRAHYLGRLDGVGCYAAEVARESVTAGPLQCCGLRSLYGQLADETFAVAGRAAHIMHWDRAHRFCGGCGAATVDHEGERAKCCPECGLLAYPRIHPAVITAVSRGDRLLLARNGRRPGRTFSIIAGFVEVGETLEAAVRREIREEVGIEVRNIRYFGSQPWPYPHSLMVGFTADHAAGEIQVDNQEIVEAGWFRVDEFPEIPSRVSISRLLIDHFVATHS